MKIDADKVVETIRARMNAKLAHANSYAMGAGSNGIRVYEAARHKSAIGFCDATDPEYRLLAELLQSGITKWPSSTGSFTRS